MEAVRGRTGGGEDKAMVRPKCYNSAPPELSTEMQDGWENKMVHDRERQKFIRTPRMVNVPFVMSTKCQQWEEYGEARLHDWNCDGCERDPR